MVASQSQEALGGLRVLVVEDSFLAASALSRMLTNFGCSVVGPAPSVSEAIRLIEQQGCDAAILDINLGKETAEPIADVLESAKRPFFFITGYTSPRLLVERHRNRRRLMKPIAESVLRAVVTEEFAPIEP